MSSGLNHVRSKLKGLRCLPCVKRHNEERLNIVRPCAKQLDQLMSQVKLGYRSSEEEVGRSSCVYSVRSQVNKRVQTSEVRVSCCVSVCTYTYQTKVCPSCYCARLLVTPTQPRFILLVVFYVSWYHLPNQGLFF